MEVIIYWAEIETGVLGQYGEDKRTNDTGNTPAGQEPFVWWPQARYRETKDMLSVGHKHGQRGSTQRWKYVRGV